MIGECYHLQFACFDILLKVISWFGTAFVCFDYLWGYGGIPILLMRLHQRGVWWEVIGTHEWRDTRA